MNMTTPLIFYNGKAVPISELPESAWLHYSPYMDEDTESAQTLYRAVPWLARGVDLRAKAVASLPFTIYRGDTEIDTSDDYQNKVGFLPDPVSLLYLVESSLTLLAKAYLLRERRGRSTTELRWMHPASIEPELSQAQGLTGFKRSVGNQVIKLSVEDVIYWWGLDPFVELGPGENSPGQAALTAAGVLYSVDQFAALFFKRGAIKAMLLTVSGNVVEGERERIKTWWRRLFEGLGNAWQTGVVNADSVKPVPIGEGVKELENTALTEDKSREISTALGIPYTLLFSQAANYATAQVDRQSFYTETIVPEADFVQRIWNKQLMEPLGYRWQFQPEALDVYQKDENERAQAFSLYVQAGLKKSVAAEMLGLDLPPGMEYEDLDDDDQEAIEERTPEQLLPFVQPSGGNGDGGQEPMQSAQAQVAEEKAIAEAIVADLKRWQRKALSRGADAPFTSEFIPLEVMAMVRAKLARAEDDDEVRAAFALGMPVATNESKAHNPRIVMLKCPVCGFDEVDRYDDHGGLCVCRNRDCGITFDPAVMV